MLILILILILIFIYIYSYRSKTSGIYQIYLGEELGYSNIYPKYFNNNQWFYNNFSNIYKTSIINKYSPTKESINISKDSINQYKIVDLLNYKQNIEKVINNDNVEINIDKLLSELLVNVHINNRLITIDDCIIINIVKNSGGFIPVLHTDIEWEIFNQSDGFQVWYLYENNTDLDNLFILETNDIIPSTYLDYKDNMIYYYNQSDDKLKKITPIDHSDHFKYLNMEEGDCFIFGKNLYHMSDFRNVINHNRKSISFRVIIKDEDGGIPINEDINHFEMGILVKQLIKGFPHKNNKIYPNRYDFINIKK